MENIKSDTAPFRAYQRILDSGESVDLCNSMIRTLDALIACDFSTRRVIESGLVKRAKLYLDLSHPSMEDAIKELDSLIVNRSYSRVIELADKADCDSTSLKASTYLLEAHRPDTFDAGVRRQRIANSATDWLSQLLNNRTVPIEVVDDSLQNDPFKELPEPTVIPDNSRPLMPDK